MATLQGYSYALGSTNTEGVNASKEGKGRRRRVQAQQGVPCTTQNAPCAKGIQFPEMRLTCVRLRVAEQPEKTRRSRTGSAKNGRHYMHFTTAATAHPSGTSIFTAGELC